MELREKIARAIFEIGGYPPANVSEWGLEAADAILALPEIREAQDRIAALELQVENMGHELQYGEGRD